MTRLRFTDRVQSRRFDMTPKHIGGLPATNTPACPRGQMAAWWLDWDFDVRPLLSTIQAPTLIMFHDGNAFVHARAAIEYVTESILERSVRCRFLLAIWSCGRHSRQCWRTKSSGS